MKILALMSALFLLVALRANTHAQEAWRDNPSVALPPELQRVLTEYEVAWRSRDSAALASLFADDGIVLTPGRNAVRGRAAIQDIYRDSGGPLFLRAIAFATNRDIGYIIGAYSHKQGAGDDGKFTLTLRKSSSGRWLIFSDMDNSNHKPAD